jgi:hypothetical protein
MELVEAKTERGGHVDLEEKQVWESRSRSAVEKNGSKTTPLEER